MTEEPLPELALTEEEVSEILRACDGEALLVGGQALAFWAQYYQITPLGVLAQHVTSDADFLGSAPAARKLAEALRPQGWRYWPVSMDDATAQTGKLSKRIEGQGIKQIDFLGNIVGLATDRIKQRGVVVSLADGGRLQVLHPLDVLESRLKNLAELPSKRDRQGVAQAQLAIDIVRGYLEQLLASGDLRQLLNAIERVGCIALDKTLNAVFHDFSLHPLAAVPADRVPSEEFQTRRWPQIRKLVAQQRAAYERRRIQLAQRKKKAPKA